MKIVYMASADRQSPQPKELFHYTSISGLSGIIESQSLWSTSYRFLNDRTEIFHLQSHLESLVVGALESIFRNNQHEWLKTLISLNKGVRHYSRLLGKTIVGATYTIMYEGQLSPSKVRHSEPFITSFCSHLSDGEYEVQNGLLSQWRGYAKGDGVAIVFNFNNYEIGCLKNPNIINTTGFYFRTFITTMGQTY